MKCLFFRQFTSRAFSRKVFHSPRFLHFGSSPGQVVAAAAAASCSAVAGRPEWPLPVRLPILFSCAKVGIGDSWVAVSIRFHGSNVCAIWIRLKTQVPTLQLAAMAWRYLSMFINAEQIMASSSFVKLPPRLDTRLPFGTWHISGEVCSVATASVNMPLPNLVWWTTSSSFGAKLGSPISSKEFPTWELGSCWLILATSR